MSKKSQLTLLIATSNQGKLQEISRMLKEYSVETLCLSQVSIDDIPEETGKTFHANALIKAQHYANLSGLTTFAEDSGLEIDALGGEPGIYSSRYGGENTDYETKNKLILSRMQDVPEPKRTARFRCVGILYSPAEKRILHEASGAMEGLIADNPMGDNGFGYDPILYIPSEGKTSAQLTPERKDELSHRGQVLRDVAEWVRSNTV